MTETPGFDIPTAHRYFSAHCFNRAWELIEKTGRTPSRTKRCCGSAWQPPGRSGQDCTSTSLSIGYWQTARIYALLGQAENARRYAQMCFEVSQQPGVKPFSGLRLRSPGAGRSGGRREGYRLRLPDRGAPFGEQVEGG